MFPPASSPCAMKMKPSGWCLTARYTITESSQKELVGKGHRFRSRSDTEVIVHLYEEIGEEVFSRLNGMFAIALWDARDKKLILARDRLGKKPLYYHDEQSEARLCLGDEGASGAARLPSARRSRQLWIIILSFFYVPSPETIFSDVAKLEPATYLVCQEGKHPQAALLERRLRPSLRRKPAGRSGRADGAAQRCREHSPGKRGSFRSFFKRRHRFQRGGRADGALDATAGQDDFHRLRRKLLSTSLPMRAWWPGTARPIIAKRFYRRASSSTCRASSTISTSPSPIPRLCRLICCARRRAGTSPWRCPAMAATKILPATSATPRRSAKIAGAILCPRPGARWRFPWRETVSRRCTAVSPRWKISTRIWPARRRARFSVSPMISNESFTGRPS